MNELGFIALVLLLDAYSMRIADHWIGFVRRRYWGVRSMGQDVFRQAPFEIALTTMRFRVWYKRNHADCEYWLAFAR